MATAYVEYPVGGKLPGHTKVDLDTYEWLDGKGVCTSHGYAVLRPHGAKGRMVQPAILHREIMGCSKGDGLHVDHINHDRLDNRRENLRVGPVKMNNANVRGRRGPYTKGAYRLPKGNWKAQVNYNGRDVHLGVFPTQKEAWWAAEQWRRENIEHYIAQDS